MGLVWDWAIAVDDRKMISLLRSRSIDFYGKDRGYPLHLEPSGEDFLSSSLGAASLMSRVLNMADFSMWLEQTMPGISEDIPLSPVANPDPCDGRLTHLDGLNLSRTGCSGISRIIYLMMILDRRIKASPSRGA